MRPSIPPEYGSVIHILTSSLADPHMRPSSHEMGNPLCSGFMLLTSDYGFVPHASLPQKENELIMWAMLSVSSTTVFLVN